MEQGGGNRKEGGGVCGRIQNPGVRIQNVLETVILDAPFQQFPGSATYPNVGLGSWDLGRGRFISACSDPGFETHVP